MRWGEAPPAPTPGVGAGGSVLRPDNRHNVNQ